MENKVGTHIPSEKDIAAIRKELAHARDKLADATVALDNGARQAALKPRTGGGEIAAQIAKLATEHALSIPGASVEDLQADLLLVQRLQPLADDLRALLQRIDDTILEANSEAWWATTALYTALSRASSGSPGLRDALAPIVKFFAVGRRAPKAAAGAKP